MLFRLLIFVACAFILYKLLAGDSKQKKMKKGSQEEKLAASGQMIKDPVCGTYVSSESDIRVKEGDKVHLFCSYECRDKYLKKLREGQESA